MTTPAHDQKLTLHILCHIPEHEPRENDPAYAAFNAMKRRMKEQGLLKCNVPGCTFPGPIEVHHSAVEFSMQGDIDLQKLNQAYGLHLTDDAEFRQWAEGPGNAEPLCPTHHRTHYGIHELPEPLWNAIRLARADVPPPAEVVTGG